MTEELMKQVEGWLKWVLGITTSAAMAMAAWALIEIVGLKVRAGVLENRQAVHQQMVDAITDEMRSIEKTGTPGLSNHASMDEQRDIELRNRISRTEAALDKLATLSEKWAIAANDIAWIKAQIEKGAKP